MVEMMRGGRKEVLSYRGGSRDLKPQRQSPKEGEGEGERGRGTWTRWEGYRQSGRIVEGNWLVARPLGRQEGLHSSYMLHIMGSYRPCWRVHKVWWIL